MSSDEKSSIRRGYDFALSLSLSLSVSLSVCLNIASFRRALRAAMWQYVLL